MLGRLLVRGTIAECKPVKGLPKMKQQLKWENKIKDYMEWLETLKNRDFWEKLPDLGKNYQGTFQRIGNSFFNDDSQ